MKYILITCLVILKLSNAFAQETLQTVTDNGNSTSNRIIVNSITQPGSRITSYGYNQGYFDVYNNYNNSISLRLLRSDGASVFEMDGHNMNTYFGGNVGIGKINAENGFKLDVNGLGAIGTSGLARLHLGTLNETTSVIQSRNLSVNQKLSFYASTYNFEVGNVGIGTVTTPQLLTLNANGGIGFQNDQISAIDKALYSLADGVLEWMTHDYATQHGFAISHQGAKRIFFNTSGNSYLTGGNFGIGTTTPTHKLSVVGDISTSYASNEGGALFIENPLKTGNNAAFRWGLYNMTGSYGNSLQFWNYSKDNTMYGARFTLTDNGNVGIGTNTPEGKLDVTGSLLLRSDLNNLSQRPALSTQKIGGEIRAYSANGYGSDDGLLRLSAGAGTNSSIMSYIDISSFSTVPDMRQNIVFGTTGTEQMRIDNVGNVGIGTTSPKEKLSVNGKIRAHEIKVEASNWPDYVFDESYKVEKLSEIEDYIKTNKHLPGFPSAHEAEANGVELGDMVKQLLKTQEELTMQLIRQNKQIELLHQKLNSISSKKSKSKK
jgi:hypothetical protein